MSWLRSGLRPAVSAAIGARQLHAACLLPALVLGACATSSAGTRERSAHVSASPRYVAVSSGYSVEMEDDGIPVQSPPLASRPRMPDDPREPYSPNYGRSAADISAQAWRPLTRASALETEAPPLPRSSDTP
jgi:hypothetical protein